MAEDFHPSSVDLGQQAGVEDGRGRSVLTDAASVEQDEALRVLRRQCQVVQCAEHGDARVDAQGIHEIEDLLLMPDVEGGRGLVEEQHAGLLGDGAGEDDALQFAARQLRGEPRSQAEQVEPCQRIFDDPPILGPLSRRKAAEVGVAAEGDVRADSDPLGITGRCGTSARMRATVRRRPRRGSRSWTRSVPMCGTSPAMACSSDDLPAPFGPTSATQSPIATVRSTSWTTGRPPRATLTRSATTGFMRPLANAAGRGGRTVLPPLP